MALAAYKGQPSWTPYLCMISYAPKRIDSGVLSLFTIIETLIYYAIVMGITGAIGGAIASKD